jgi:hypothetical protein
MSNIETFESLIAAARATLPTRFCRVVAMREHGDFGYVLFDTSSQDQPYLYGVNYQRVDGRWLEGSSSNGDGWSHMGSDPRIGTLALWGQAPAGADRVRVELGGQSREEAIENGIYLVVWWGVPVDLGLWQITFRINGQWR